MNALEKRPGPFLKFFLKVPVWLYKIGLGGWERMMGAEWMLIITKGRKTGKPREVMVDVMDYDSSTDTYYVESAYGARADWVRNIQAHPEFEARVGRRKFKAQATILIGETTADQFVNFYRKKPVYTRSVMAMVGMNFNSEAELRTIASKLILLAIHPNQ
ncbi:MAG: nitroreductase family deazaflavin-dependent oxidoreductase [Anaerolineales bacterium]